jgi:hypothetical protein
MHSETKLVAKLNIYISSCIAVLRFRVQPIPEQSFLPYAYKKIFDFELLNEIAKSDSNYMEVIVTGGATNFRFFFLKNNST